MRIVVLRAGDAVPDVAQRRGEFAELIRETLGPSHQGTWETVDVRTDAKLPDPRSADAFIMTGSSSSVTERAPWMLRAEAHLRDIADAGVPLLGICFGHQMIAQALGGEVVKNPRGREMGSVEVTRLAHDPIFEGLSDRFLVSATHVDTVDKLPPGARVLAHTVLEPTAAFAIGDHVRGVQFHPELDHEAMHGYVRARADKILADGLDPKVIAAGIRESHANGQVLRNFVAHVRKRQK